MCVCVCVCVCVGAGVCVCVCMCVCGGARCHYGVLRERETESSEYICAIQCMLRHLSCLYVSADFISGVFNVLK